MKRIVSTTSNLDSLLERLEDARDAGQPLTIDQVCSDCPEMKEKLREEWERLQRFDNNYLVAPDETIAETPAEIAVKLNDNSEDLIGSKQAMQTEFYYESRYAEGGLGYVYLASDPELSRKLAVKLPKTHNTSTGQGDFQRETEIIGRLNHPGVVSIIGAGETVDGRPFYAMPFMDSGDLNTRVTKYHATHSPRLDPTVPEFRDLVSRLVSVCKAIAYVHSRGIVHCDLKPQNVVLGNYGETVVIDWGSARKVKCDARFKVHDDPSVLLTATGHSTSNYITLRYASPEQLGDGEVGPESDIYSLGAMLYKLLTGKAPYEGVHNCDVARRVLAGHLEPPRTHKAGVPRALSAICLKAMATQPEQRYANALDLADDLERYLADTPVTACRERISTTIVRGVRRNRLASIVLLGTFLLAGAALSMAYARRTVLSMQLKSTADERLQLASSLVARVSKLEIKQRLKLLERQAADAALLAAMLAVHQAPDDRTTWKTVQTLLYRFNHEVESDGIHVESMFITDARGIQIARVEETETIGDSFAYRHYFHGNEHDLPDTEALRGSPPPPARSPVLSTVYQSTNPDRETGEFPIKTAFSVAIVDRSGTSGAQILGRLAMSVNINQLEMFNQLRELSLQATLVEMRDYPWGTGNAQGLIIDSIGHSAISKQGLYRQIEQPADELELKDRIPRLNSETLRLLQESSGRHDVGFLTRLSDPHICEQPQDVACNFIKLPLSANAPDKYWAIIVTELPNSQ